MSSTRPDSPKDPESRGSEPQGLGHYWDTLPKQITAITAVVVAMGGLVAGVRALIVALQPSSHTSTSVASNTSSKIATSTSQTDSTTTTRGQFQAFTLGQPKLAVRNAPTNSAQAVGQLPYHTTVFIVCTKIGEAVTGPGPVTTPVWDKIRTDASSDPIGFAPDALVDTGTATPQAPTC
jgi:hypothetical protein